jgi:hypothetical protein
MNGAKDIDINIDYERTRRLCTQHFAQCLHDTVECESDPRAETDWKTAEELLGKYPRVLYWAMRALAAHLLMHPEADVYDRQTFEKVCGERLWSAIQPMRIRDLPRPPYGAITFH